MLRAQSVTKDYIRAEGEVHKKRYAVEMLVGVLSPVNHNGLYQG